MLICQVLKPLVSTNRIPGFEHKHLQVVLDGSTQKVAVDAVGCIPGDWVICVGSSAAREAAGSKSYPSDLTIVGIIDHWNPDAGKAEPKTTSTATPTSVDGPEGGGALMEIMQVTGSITCTQRVDGLGHMNLRVLRNTKGKESVAVDQVGASPGNWVFTASGSAARFACTNPETLTDLTIAGIIDHWTPDG